jgi:hypothetical protein
VFIHEYFGIVTKDASVNIIEAKTNVAYECQINIASQSKVNTTPSQQIYIYI